MPKFDRPYTTNPLTYKHQNWHVWLRPPPLSTCQIWLELVNWGPFHKYVKYNNFVTFSTFPPLSFFTARCTLVQSAVLRSYVVRLSVRLCVMFRYHDHIGWNSSKIISRPNSLGLVWGLTPIWAIWCNENTPKNWGGIGGGVTRECKKTCNISETVQDRTKVTITD